MSRGLQLLQSKIAVLEDLIDRTDNQGQTLLSMMETKTAELKIRIKEAEEELKNIEESRKKSLEVAKIFQDKVPHDDILQMQKSQKYVKAAKMANAGIDIKEIARQVDLSLGELEFISKVNQDELQFSDQDLPGWIEDSAVVKTNEIQNSTPAVNRSVHKTDSQKLEDLGNKFRQVMASGNTAIMGASSSVSPVPNTGMGSATVVKSNFGNPSAAVKQPVNEPGQIKRVVFPKIQSGSF
jgi:hypothetical protein